MRAFFRTRRTRAVCPSGRLQVPLVLAAMSLCVSTVAMAADDGPADQMSQLSAAERTRIDDLALQLPREVLRKRTRESLGDVRSWLAGRAPLPLTEELDRVDQVHRRVVAGHGIQPTPDALQRVLGQLGRVLPARFHPEAGAFLVTVIDAPQFVSESAGQHRLYLSTAALERIGSDDGMADRLAFVLGGQIAMSCLGHCRAWHQAQWAGESLRARGSAEKLVDAAPSTAEGFILGRRPAVSQTFAEDLFALHLCRAAGFDVSSGLDVLRHEARSEQTDASAVEMPLRRLRRLQMELRGLVAGEDYGLFEHSDGVWLRAPDDALMSGGRAVVLLHGLGSDLSTFDELLAELGPALEGTRVLGLAYPRTGSLFRSGRFLKRELTRTGADSADFDFICHSAGGLVFRQAAEQEGVGFRSATLIGTPNSGSDLSSLRPLIEAQKFFGSLRVSFSRSLTEVVEDDTTQMVRDLTPGSLFLHELNANPPVGLQRRYQIVRGQALSTRKAMLLALGVGTARATLRNVSRRKLSGQAGKAAESFASRLRVPAEVRNGDLAVSLSSATTPDPAEMLTVPASHTKLPENPQVIELVRHTISR